MQEIFCHVDAIELLEPDVYRINLTPKEGDFPPYQGGQYLTVQVEDGRWIPFSIGNAPEEKSHIELHIRLIPGHDLAEQIVTQFKSKRTAHIQIPMGRCVLKDSSRKVACIVGGTGFSPIKAMIESAIAQQLKREISLFWGAQTKADFYLKSLPEQWQLENSNFKFIPVVSGDDSTWQGATGLAHNAAMKQLTNLNEYDFYLSGSEAMVMAVFHDLVAAQVPKQQIFADMLDIKRDMGQQL